MEVLGQELGEYGNRKIKFKEVGQGNICVESLNTLFHQRP